MVRFRGTSGRELTSVLYFVATISYGATITKPQVQKPQNSEQAICSSYNIPNAISWSCKRIKDCQWSYSVVNTPNEHSCGTEKICCPERIKNVTKPSTTTIISQKFPSVTPRPSPTSSSRKDYAQIIRKKCEQYAKARFVESCTGDDIFGQQKVCELKMDCTDLTEPLIVGGKDAAHKEFPHMALIGSGTDEDNIIWVCGGSLISERFILSAAHCTNEGSESTKVRWAALGVLVRREAIEGKLNDKVFQIVRTINHPNYKEVRANYDIALYELKNAIKFSPLVRPICLHVEASAPQVDTRAIITGWGLNETGFDVVETLQKASVNILANNLCSQKYGSDTKLEKGFEARSMLCAGDLRSDIDTCSGDSGGPIQIKHKEECMYVQIGITSIGDPYCGSRQPAIYTRVFAYIEWIGKTVWPNEV